MEQLYVRKELFPLSEDGPTYLKATDAEVWAYAATLDGAEPDYEAAQKIIDNGWRGAVPIVDAALAGRKIIPLPDKETTDE